MLRAVALARTCAAVTRAQPGVGSVHALLRANISFVPGKKFKLSDSVVKSPAKKRESSLFSNINLRPDDAAATSADGSTQGETNPRQGPEITSAAIASSGMQTRKRVKGASLLPQTPSYGVKLPSEAQNQEQERDFDLESEEEAAMVEAWLRAQEEMRQASEKRVKEQALAKLAEAQDNDPLIPDEKLASRLEDINEEIDLIKLESIEKKFDEITESRAKRILGYAAALEARDKLLIEKGKDAVDEKFLPMETDYEIDIDEEAELTEGEMKEIENVIDAGNEGDPDLDMLRLLIANAKSEADAGDNENTQTTALARTGNSSLATSNQQERVPTFVDKLLLHKPEGEEDQEFSDSDVEFEYRFQKAKAEMNPEDFQRDIQILRERVAISEEADKEDLEDIFGDASPVKMARGSANSDEDVPPPNRIELPLEPTPDQDPIPEIDVSEPVPPQTVLFGDIPFPTKLPEQPYSLRVCIIGTPNAGKSEFVNNITRAKVTAVSPKRNTTRRQTLGIFTEGNTQITLYDTPGINEIYTAKQYQRELSTAAWDAVGDADFVFVIVDAAKHLGGPELFLIAKCKQVVEENPNVRLVLVLNKVDLVEPKYKLLNLLSRLELLAPWTDCFMVSASTGDGMADVENYMFMNAVPRDWEHAADVPTDRTEVEQASEIIRGCVYRRLHKEIPYAVAQETIEWSVLRDGSLRLDQRLLVEKESHRKIIAGKALRQITKAAQMELAKAFNRKVHLYLRVQQRDKIDPRFRT